ncbi:MAG: TadE/TadG family type IV pilus assembly protein [Pseudomonadota bacterium]
MRFFKCIVAVSRKQRTQLKDWAADKRGATALEFALVAAPLLFMLTAILEVGVVFVMSVAVEHGISQASRAIRTGQFQTGGLTESEFRTAVCAEFLGLLPCDGNLFIDVRTFASFGDSQNVSPIDPDTQDFDSSEFQFNPGNRDEVVVARAFYEWNLITPGLTSIFSNTSNNSYLISATTAFRNEPF